MNLSEMLKLITWSVDQFKRNYPLEFDEFTSDHKVDFPTEEDYKYKYNLHMGIDNYLFYEYVPQPNFIVLILNNELLKFVGNEYDYKFHLVDRTKSTIIITKENVLYLLKMLKIDYIENEMIDFTNLVNKYNEVMNGSDSISKSKTERYTIQIPNRISSVNAKI